MTVVDEEETTASVPSPGSSTPGELLGRLGLWAGLLVVAACCTFVFVQLEPSLLLRNTTPSGGDTAAHVWWPAYLRDHLLPFRIAGWSSDFYGGFPAGQFYFPLPALMIVALDVVIPYNIAFKLITALGPVLLPIAAYIFGRGLRAPNPAPAGFAVAMTALLFFTGDPVDPTIAFNQRIAGGTIASTLAGEFSFTLALAFALAFMGTFAYTLRTGRHRWIPAVLLAATVTSHLIVAIFAALGALAVWLAHRPWFNLRRALVIGAVGALLTAVWVLPLVATIGYTTDMRYDAIACSETKKHPTDVTCSDRHDLDPARYLFPSHMWGVDGAMPWEWVGGWWPWEWGAATLTGIAIVGAAVRRGRRAETVGVLVFMAVGAALLFRYWESLQSTTVWNLRLLPFWYVAVFLLMGLGAAELVRGAGWVARSFARDWRTKAPPPLVRSATIAALTVALSIGTLISVNNEKQDSFLTSWINWNYGGYEDTTGANGKTAVKAYPEYRSLMDTMGTLAPGRATWEGNTQLNEYGSPLALMLMPYWTHGRIASTEGVYFEASASTPYHFMTVATLAAAGNASNAVRGVPYRDSSQFALGVRWLRLQGVRYLVVHSPASKAAADADRRLRLVATSPDTDNKPPLGWSIYRVSRSKLVEPLRYRPVVVDDSTAAERAACDRRVGQLLGKPEPVKNHEWQDCIAVPWFNAPKALDRPLVADGPAAWQHATPSEARGLSKQPLPDVRVRKIRATDDTVSFRVSRVGVPVYVKTSYFPNWEVEGARGPYRSTPNYMVVVPTERDVTLHYGTTTAEWLGRLGTLVGVVGLSLLAFGPWWRRRRSGAADRTEAVESAAS